MKQKFMLLDIDSKYAISNTGIVKNVISGKELSQKTMNGYTVSQLYINGKRQNFKIHRLVGMAFIPNPENKPYINHLDGDKTNNFVHNLEWCTAKENDTHARANGLKNQNKPIKATDVETGEQLVFESLSEAARHFSCNKAYIHRVVKNTHGRTVYKKNRFEYI